MMIGRLSEAIFKDERQWSINVKDG